MPGPPVGGGPSWAEVVLWTDHDVDEDYDRAAGVPATHERPSAIERGLYGGGSRGTVLT